MDRSLFPLLLAEVKRLLALRGYGPDETETEEFHHWFVDRFLDDPEHYQRQFRNAHPSSVSQWAEAYIEERFADWLADSQRSLGDCLSDTFMRT